MTRRGTPTAVAVPTMKVVLFALVCAAACVVGDNGPIDRTGQGGGTGGGDGDGDGNGDGNGGTVDGGVAAACTGAAYDPCTDAAQCTSGICQPFEQDGIQVCSQACTPGDATTCPQLNGQPATCNNRGICKPPGQNTCTR